MNGNRERRTTVTIANPKQFSPVIVLLLLFCSATSTTPATAASAVGSAVDRILLWLADDDSEGRWRETNRRS